MKSIAVLIYVLAQMGAPAKYRSDIAKYTHKYSLKYDIDPLLALAVMYHESRFRPYINNPRFHDYGLMQIHCPSRNYVLWCRDLKKLKTIKYNIKIGIYILSTWKKKCIKRHIHKYHWVRHYNWYSKDYDKRVLKVYERIKRIANEYKERERFNN